MQSVCTLTVGTRAYVKLDCTHMRLLCKHMRIVRSTIYLRLAQRDEYTTYYCTIMIYGIIFGNQMPITTFIDVRVERDTGICRATNAERPGDVLPKFLSSWKSLEV